MATFSLTVIHGHHGLIKDCGYLTAFELIDGKLQPETKRQMRTVLKLTR
jgi:hypothetical protein